MPDNHTIDTALAEADAHIQRINTAAIPVGHLPDVDTLRNRQQSKTFSADSDDDKEYSDITRANAVDGEQPE